MPRHDCSRPGCVAAAEGTPVLAVPSSPLSVNTKYQGVRSILWLPLCRRHFTAIDTREFFSGEVIAGMRASIEHDFRENKALPDWDKAKVQWLGKNHTEFRKYEKIYLNVRAGTPADIAVKAEAGKAN
jgi:hypothetical protein